MATATSRLRAAGDRVARFGHLVRFSHSVFALPFAVGGVLFAVRAAGSWPPPSTWGWVVAAMVAARSAAMAFNRIVDARVDAANPRTRGREIPRGAISMRAAWLFTAAAAAAFVFAAHRLNPLAFALSPAALAIVGFYSFTKRFTWTSHLFLGLALGVAPVGGWVAVTGRLDVLPFVVALGVLLWVAGFDVLYSLQDLEYDRTRGLHSFPVRFGIRRSLMAARLLHAGAVAVLAAPAWLAGLSHWYLAGIAFIAGVLAWEHSLVRPWDLSRLDRAFFDMNAVVSVAFLAASVLGVLL